jgi:hypothetical protein
MTNSDPTGGNVSESDATKLLETATNYRSQQPLPGIIQIPIFSRYFRTMSRLQRVLHNHPSGDPTPSHADVQMTQQIIAVASPLGIAVHDHIVVGKEGHASLKGLKLI